MSKLEYCSSQDYHYVSAMHYPTVEAIVGKCRYIVERDRYVLTECQAVIYKESLKMNKTYFIAMDPSEFAVTPTNCRNALDFAESEDSISEVDYTQFQALRKAVQEHFNNPYDLTQFKDELGSGFEASISYHNEPSIQAWELLNSYAQVHNWLHMTYRLTGTYRTVNYSNNSVATRSSGYNYLIRFYSQEV